MMKKRTPYQKKRVRYILVLIAAGGIIAAAFLSILLSVSSLIYHRYIAKDDWVDYDRVEVAKPEIEELFLTPNVNSRPQIALKKVKGIVIHYTANPGTDAKANRDYFESRKNEADSAENKVSSHFVVGLDGQIIQCIPLDEIAYASNDRNKDTISIECCHPDKSGKFSDQTYQSLIQLTAWLCDTYEIKQKQIIRHYDVTGKLCPKYYVKHPKAWKKLKQDVWNCFFDAKR